MGGGGDPHKERLPMVPLLHEFNLLSLLGIWGGLSTVVLLVHPRCSRNGFFSFGHLITNLTPSARWGHQREMRRLNLGKIGKTSIHKKKCFLTPNSRRSSRLTSLFGEDQSRAAN